MASGLISVEDAVGEARAAENAVVRDGGFCAYLLAFGYNPQLRDGLSGQVAVEDGAALDFARKREELRARVQSIVLELKPRRRCVTCCGNVLGVLSAGLNLTRASRRARGRSRRASSLADGGWGRAAF